MWCWTPFISALQKQSQVELCEFKDSLSTKRVPGQWRLHKRDPVSKQMNKKHFGTKLTNPNILCKNVLSENYATKKEKRKRERESEKEKRAFVLLLEPSGVIMECVCVLRSQPLVHPTQIHYHWTRARTLNITLFKKKKGKAVFLVLWPNPSN